MLSYEDIILLGEERVLVIQEHEEGRCWCGETWCRDDYCPGSPSHWMQAVLPDGHRRKGFGPP